MKIKCFRVCFFISLLVCFFSCSIASNGSNETAPANEQSSDGTTIQNPDPVNSDEDSLVKEAMDLYGINLNDTTGRIGYPFIDISVGSPDNHPFINMCFDSIYYHGDEAVVANDPDGNTRIVLWRGNYDVKGTVGNAGSIFLKQRYSDSVGVFGAGAEICVYKKATYSLERPVAPDYHFFGPAPDGSSPPIPLPPIMNCFSDKIGGTRFPPVHDLRVDCNHIGTVITGFLNSTLGSLPNPASMADWWGMGPTFKLEPEMVQTEVSVPHFCDFEYVYHLCSKTVVTSEPVPGAGYMEYPVWHQTGYTSVPIPGAGYYQPSSAVWHSTGSWPWDGYWEYPVWHQTGYSSVPIPGAGYNEPEVAVWHQTGYVDVPHEEPYWTTNCGKTGAPHQAPTWVEKCDHKGFPHTATVASVETPEHYMERYKDMFNNTFINNWNNSPYKSYTHLMPYSVKNFDNPDTPVIELRLVSKDDYFLSNGDSVKKGQVIVSDKRKTWWLNIWTGGDGVKGVFNVDRLTGSAIDWNKTVLYFRIEGYYNNKWQKWDNGRQCGGALEGAGDVKDGDYNYVNNLTAQDVTL
jgi:hypothetical protein